MLFASLLEMWALVHQVTKAVLSDESRSLTVIQQHLRFDERPSKVKDNYLVNHSLSLDFIQRVVLPGVERRLEKYGWDDPGFIDNCFSGDPEPVTTTIPPSWTIPPTPPLPSEHVAPPSNPAKSVDDDSTSNINMARLLRESQAAAVVPLVAFGRDKRYLDTSELDGLLEMFIKDDEVSIIKCLPFVQLSSEFVPENIRTPYAVTAINTFDGMERPRHWMARFTMDISSACLLYSIRWQCQTMTATRCATTSGINQMTCLVVSR